MKKIFNLLLVVILGFMFIGSTFENVDASAGANNKTLVLENLVDNGSFDTDMVNWSILANSMAIWNSGTALSDVTSDIISTYQEILGNIDDIIYVIGDVDKTSGSGAAFYILPKGAGAGSILNLMVHTDYTAQIDGTEVTYSGITTLNNDGFRIVFGRTSIQTFSFDMDNIMAFNLTELFGVGNEPTLSEFEVILADAPDYFEEWNYNYYEYDNTIIEVGCQRTATNLIDNGDFSDVLSGWNITLGTGVMVIETNVAKINTDYDFGRVYTSSLIQDHKYYQYVDFKSNNITHFSHIGVRDNIAVLGTTNFDNDIWYNYSNIYTPPTGTDFRLYAYNTLNVHDLNYYMYYDNIMVFDLTEMYGQGNEPTVEEFEYFMGAEDVLGYHTDEFDYDDTCYMTVEQNSPIYMYSDYIENRAGTLYLTMTDTIKDLPVTNPRITIHKYDLNMNYIGNLYTGFITDYNDDDLDGYYDHTFVYDLPDPVTTEEGYIYIAYDHLNQNILASGYFFNPVSDEFANLAGNNAIAVNDSAYGELQEPYQYSQYSDYNDYMFNDNEFLITHIRYDTLAYSDTTLSFYNESTDQIQTVNVEPLYNQLCDVYEGGSFVDVNECYFYASSGGIFPPLFNYLESSQIAHNQYLVDSLNYYENNFLGFFYDAGYADNEGVYTYSLINQGGNFAGQSPIFNFDSFHTFSLISHSIKEGGVLRARITKPYNYLDDAFDYQYLFDNNTSVYYFDIDKDPEQDLYLEVFSGLTPEDATVTYNLRRNTDFRNGVSGGTYTTIITDDYVMRPIIPFDEKVDNGLDVIGMNDAVGKIIISAVVIIFVSIGGFFVSRRNVLITLLLDFLALALLMVLGIVPTWIMLFILVILLVSIFVKRKGD